MSWAKTIGFMPGRPLGLNRSSFARPFSSSTGVKHFSALAV